MYHIQRKHFQMLQQQQKLNYFILIWSCFITYSLQSIVFLNSSFLSLFLSKLSFLSFFTYVPRFWNLNMKLLNRDYWGNLYYVVSTILLNRSQVGKSIFLCELMSLDSTKSNERIHTRKWVPKLKHHRIDEQKLAGKLC